MERGVVKTGLAKVAGTKFQQKIYLANLKDDPCRTEGDLHTLWVGLILLPVKNTFNIIFLHLLEENSCEVNKVYPDNLLLMQGK